MADQVKSTTIEERVAKVVSEQLGYKRADITPDLSFEAMGADSLDHIELVMAMEREFDIEIPDTEADAMLTPRAAVDFVRKTLTT